MNFSDAEVNFIIDALPIIWIEREIYKSFINKTKVKYKPDKPVEALSLVLGCGILSADSDFKKTININELIKRLG